MLTTYTIAASFALALQTQIVKAPSSLVIVSPKKAGFKSTGFGERRGGRVSACDKLLECAALMREGSHAIYWRRFTSKDGRVITFETKIRRRRNQCTAPGCLGRALISQSAESQQHRSSSLRICVHVARRNGNSLRHCRCAEKKHEQ